jgi:hypothetical protein
MSQSARICTSRPSESSFLAEPMLIETSAQGSSVKSAAT